MIIEDKNVPSTITKEELKKDDILIFENNSTMVLGANNMYVLDQYYDDQLQCIDKPEYSVEKIYRPQYIKIYQRKKIGGR